METEQILAGIKDADMVLVGMGEDFDDMKRLQGCPVIIYQRRENDDRNIRRRLIRLHKLCKPVPVHLRHLNIRDNQTDMLFQCAVSLTLRNHVISPLSLSSRMAS